MSKSQIIIDHIKSQAVSVKTAPLAQTNNESKQANHKTKLDKDKSNKAKTKKKQKKKKKKIPTQI